MAELIWTEESEQSIESHVGVAVMVATSLAKLLLPVEFLIRSQTDIYSAALLRAPLDR
jgi:hypothetical protein